MDKILENVGKLLDKVTPGRVLLIGLLIAFAVLGWVGYQNSDKIGAKYLTPGFKGKTELVTLSAHSTSAIDKFMQKYPDTVSFLSVLKFDFSTNTRTPIYRAFNDGDVRLIVEQQLKGGQTGVAAIFVKYDEGNNNQMISLIQGEFSCAPVGEGGVVRVFPNALNKFKFSCSVPIPPAFGGGGARGYIAVHFTNIPSKYQLEQIKLDMMTLAMYIYSVDVEAVQTVILQN